jgi:inorganic pyrophosphatase
MRGSSIDGLGAFDDKGYLNVIIETPQDTANKLKWDPKIGLFKLSHVLPAGSVFPFDFGFVPGTKGGDGDPLDVLLLTDQPLPVACLVESRLIGVIEAEQMAEGKTERNDRLLAVAVESRNDRHLRDLRDLESHRLDEIEHFFIAYNQMRGRVFKPLARRGAKAATALVERSVDREEQQHGQR